MKQEHLTEKRQTIFQNSDSFSLTTTSTDVATWISPPKPITLAGVRFSAGFTITGADTNTSKISLAKVANPISTKIYAEIELASGVDITFGSYLDLTILDAVVPANTVLGFAHIRVGTGLAGQSLFRGCMELVYS